MAKGSEAPYPRWTFQKPKPLEKEMEGSAILHPAGPDEYVIVGYKTLFPFNGLTHEEFMDAPMKPSQFADTRPTRDCEELGVQIQTLCRERGITASAAADVVFGN
jgi:hypothetical protein